MEQVELLLRVILALEVQCLSKTGEHFMADIAMEQFSASDLAEGLMHLLDLPHSLLGVEPHE